MARRLLVFILLLSSVFFAQNFEYIRTVYQGQDITSAYLDGKEVLSLLGNNQQTLERAVSVLAQIQLFSELNYSFKGLSWQKTKGKHLLYWDKEVIAELSQEEMNINNKRKNDLIKAVKVFENIDGDKVVLGNEQDQSFKKTMTLYKKNLVSYDGILPAVHNHYPLGTMLRLQNPDTDWTVVIKIVDNDKAMDEGSLGVDENTLKALGMKSKKKVKVEVI